MRCCGEERDTPFCPQCGQPVGNLGTLQRLLRHCRTQLHAHQLRHAEWVAACPHLTKNQKVGSERVTEKWQGWCDALAELLAAPAASMETD